ncbi:MAG: hypothetical protein HY367_01615 [Candidatus Aenigmarchaeota archaeon]|nr:hypothetical protein [Candidatus Aenigmarchaeota archaeon]
MAETLPLERLKRLSNALEGFEAEISRPLRGAREEYDSRSKKEGAAMYDLAAQRVYSVSRVLLENYQHLGGDSGALDGLEGDVQELHDTLARKEYDRVPILMIGIGKKVDSARMAIDYLISVETEGLKYKSTS